MKREQEKETNFVSSKCLKSLDIDLSKSELFVHKIVNSQIIVFVLLKQLDKIFNRC